MLAGDTADLKRSIMSNWQWSWAPAGGKRRSVSALLRMIMLA